MYSYCTCISMDSHKFVFVVMQHVNELQLTKVKIMILNAVEREKGHVY